MKKWIYLILLIISAITLSACNGDSSNGEGGRAPVYQGMTIFTSTNTQTNALNQIILTSFNLNTNQDMNVDDKIKDDMDIIVSSEIEYFAARNQDVYIRVRLNNPDSQVILRFKLNGVFYQISEFQPGSDSENLILKVNAGDVSGIKEFTIDEIKYIENLTNLTKDALFEGDRTVKLGVTYESVPIATLVDSDVKATSMSFNLQVTDSNNLIQRSGNTIKAYLYDGDNIIRTEDLSLGTNLIQFDNLPFDSNYEFAVAAVYDSLDGLGNRVGILYQSTLRTEKIIELRPGNSTHASISFDLSFNDEVGMITAIELYQGETLIEALTDLSVREFTNLLSNNVYQIKVTYTYDLNDGLGEQSLFITETVTTLAKANPVVIVEDVIPTQESITFEIDITDIDEVGSITSIELYQGETLIEALTDLSVRAFTDLLSNNAYQIKVTYTYDLNDGFSATISEVDFYVKTLPYPIEIINHQIKNNGIFVNGITLAINFELINKNNLKIENLYINNSVIKVSRLVDSYFVNYVIEAPQGIYEITIDAFEYNENGINVVMSLDEPYKLDVIVSQKLELDKIESQNGQSYFKLSEGLPIVLYFDSVFDYEIYEVVFNPGGFEQALQGYFKTSNIQEIGPDYIVINYNPEEFILNMTQEFIIYSIEIKYGNDINNFQSSIYSYKDIFYGLTDITIYPISSIEDFQNMKSDRIYLLNNDIDGSGYNIQPIEFRGVLIGGGYTIKNISIFRETNTEGFGLFRNFHGILEGVNFDNIILNITNNSSYYKSVALFGYIGVSKIKNVRVSNIFITLISNTPDREFVGGFALGIANSVIEKMELINIVLEGDKNSEERAIAYQLASVKIRETFIDDILIDQDY